MGDAQQVEDAGDEEIDQVVDGLGLGVKGRGGGANYTAGVGDFEHAFQVGGGKGGFAVDQDEGAFLF